VCVFVVFVFRKSFDLGVLKPVPPGAQAENEKNIEKERVLHCQPFRKPPFPSLTSN
jgi:hypothetical protein